jgi:hypothetical protein
MALAALHYPHASDTDPPGASVNAAAVMQCCCEFLRNPPAADVSAAPAEVIVSGGGAPERTGGAECAAEDCSPCGESECRLRPPAAGESAPREETLEPKKKESKVRHTIPIYVVSAFMSSYSGTFWGAGHFVGASFIPRHFSSTEHLAYSDRPLTTFKVKLALYSSRL